MAFHIPDFESLQKALAKDPAQQSVAPLKVTEGLGSGFLSSEGIAVAKNVSYTTQYRDNLDPNFFQEKHSNGAMGYSMSFDRDASSGTTHSLFDGADTFSLDHPLDMINPQSLSVFRNGMALEEHTQWKIKSANGAIQLRTPIKSTDDDIQVRYEYFNGVVALNVLLLMKEQFTEEQLRDFAPDLGDVFSIDNLIKDNAQLAPYAGQKGRVVSYEIRSYGVIGNLQLLKGGF